MGDWLLKKSTGQTIRNFTLNNACRDIVYLTLWVWRDILVNALANDDMTEVEVLPILKNIRQTVGDEFYHDFLEVQNFDAVNTSNLDSFNSDSSSSLP